MCHLHARSDTECPTGSVPKQLTLIQQHCNQGTLFDTTPNQFNHQIYHVKLHCKTLISFRKICPIKVVLAEKWKHAHL
jgi:hypothetical protein